MTAPLHRILVADDEELIRKSFHHAFANQVAATDFDKLEAELFGPSDSSRSTTPEYDINSVAQGDDAVSAVKLSIQSGTPFAVAFLDMRMPPGIGGAETAKRIRDLDPLVNIVLVTGYSDTDIARVADDVKPADKLFFIAKPLQVTEIRQQVAALSARWSAETRMVSNLQAQNAKLEAALHDAGLAREEALHASFSKSAFLSNVSHELRTPLNAIIGFSELMGGEVYGPMGDERYADYAREINGAGNSLLRSINDIIDTARLDIGKITLCIEALNLVDIIQRVVDDLATLSASKNVTVMQTRKSQELIVQGDQKRVQQVLTAIVRNAIEFAPFDSQVTIDTHVDRQKAVLTIRDHGPGISAKLVEAVSRPFAHDVNVLTRDHGGLGLGLWLSVRLMELHQGSLEITASPQAGTTVVLAFPLTQNAAKVA